MRKLVFYSEAVDQFFIFHQFANDMNWESAFQFSALIPSEYGQLSVHPHELLDFVFIGDL